MPQTAIRAVRQAKGLTLQEVADRVGATAATVSRWEREPQRVTVPVLGNLARVLDCHPSALLACATGADIRASKQQEVPEAEQHNAEMIRSLSGFDAEKLLAATAVTDVMAPTICPGDVCLVDETIQVNRSGIYAMKGPDFVGFCRMLPVPPRSQVIVMFDSPLYPVRETISADEFLSTAIGRVISITKKV